MSKFVRVFCITLSLVLLLSSNILKAESYQTTYINGTNVNIRASASTSAASLGKIDNDTVILLGPTAKVQGMTYLWYNIRYGNITGWIYGDPEWFSINPSPPSSGGSDATFEEQLKAFPSSYHQALRDLHAIYPNWKFVADNIDFSFDSAVNEQYFNYRKHVELSQGIAWRSLYGEAYNWGEGTWKIYDGDRWVAASREVIAYYMDPRNFLNRSSVYMFLNQSYDSVNHTEEGLSKIIAGTFLANNYTPDTSNSLDAQYGGSYSKVIMAAAQESGVSPYIIASKIIVEQGSAGTSALISGTYSGYEGYYNFLNWGAYGQGNAAIIQSGLETAKSNGWNSRAAAIIGGSKKLADGYVNNRQHTYYYMAFNVLNKVYYHQYESSIYAAYNKAQKMSNTYATNYEAPLVFSIPVYTSIPDAVSTKAQVGDNRYNNYYLTKMSVSGLSPAFNMFTQQYSLSVSGDTTVYVDKPSSASIVSQTQFDLVPGSNTVRITVKSQSEFTNTYTLTVTASAPCKLTISTGQETPPSTSTVKKGDTNNDGYITIVDLANVQKHLLGKIVLTGDNFSGADTNKDGKITIVDLANIQKHLLGKITLS